MREDIVVRNSGEEPAYCQLELDVGADFAALFDVKEGKPARPGEYACELVDGSVVFRWRKGSVRRGSRVTSSQPANIDGEHLLFEVIVPARGEWSSCFQLTPIIDEEEIEPRYKCGEPVERATPNEPLRKSRREGPPLATA